MPEAALREAEQKVLPRRPRKERGFLFQASRRLQHRVFQMWEAGAQPLAAQAEADDRPQQAPVMCYNEKATNDHINGYALGDTNETKPEAPMSSTGLSASEAVLNGMCVCVCVSWTVGRPRLWAAFEQWKQCWTRTHGAMAPVTLPRSLRTVRRTSA